MSPTGGFVLRQSNITPPTPGDVLSWPSDFIYLGSQRLTSPSVGDMAYGNGFTVRRESSDMTNPVHFITSAFYPASVWSGTQRVKLTLRGSTISVYINDGGGYPVTPDLSVVDSSVTAAGRAGILFGTVAGYSIDSFVATDFGGGVFSSDVFTGTNGTTLASHTGSIGASWTVHPTLANGTAAIQSNSIVLSGGDQVHYYSSGVPANADYDVEADISYLSGAASAGVWGRLSTSAGSGYTVFYYQVGTNKLWILAKLVAGTYTTLATIPSPRGAVGIAAYTYELRAIPPENPSNPTDSFSYSAAPIVKEYGNVYGSGPSKRIGVYAGQPYDFNDGASGTLRFGSLAWDPIGSKLYWTFGETYSGELSQYLGYSELDYSTGQSTAHGAWFTDSTGYKGGLTGVLNIPSSFVTQASLGTKRLATIGSPPASVQAAGDVSPGPQLTAFAPPIGVTEQTSIVSRRIVGYAPFTNDPGPGQSRAIRPASIQWYQGAGSAVVAPYSNWPFTYWNGYDSSFGGVWIHGTAKSGFITVNQLFKGQATYVHAHNTPQMLVNSLSIMSEADILEVVNGTLQPYEVQPVTTQLTFPFLDPADFTSVQIVTISSITSTAGVSRTIGAVVTTSAPHGLPSIGEIGVIGCSSDQYNDNWDFTVLNATQIQISNPSLDLFTFDGTTATGGALWNVGLGGYPGSGIKILGLAYDEIDQILYFGFVSKQNIPMVAAWQILCN